MQHGAYRVITRAGEEEGALLGNKSSGDDDEYDDFPIGSPSQGISNNAAIATVLGAALLIGLAVTYALGGFAPPPPPEPPDVSAQFANAISSSQGLQGLDDYGPPPPPEDLPGAASRLHPDDDSSHMKIGSGEDVDSGLDSYGAPSPPDEQPGAASRLHKNSDTKLVVGSEQSESNSALSQGQNTTLPTEKTKYELDEETVKKFEVL